MEKFDLATFDLTSPLSWEALGKMWQVTHGDTPTTEQLMQFVMGMGTGQPAQIEAEGWDMKDAHSSGQVWGGSRGTRGGFYRGRARGGFTHGKVRNVHEGWGYDGNSQSTDAIVLGGGSDDMDVSPPEQKHVASETDGGGPGGRMQRMGDKWVFVRDQGAAGIS
jgi:protein NRD1